MLYKVLNFMSDCDSKNRETSGSRRVKACLGFVMLIGLIMLLKKGGKKVTETVVAWDTEDEIRHQLSNHYVRQYNLRQSQDLANTGLDIFGNKFLPLLATEDISQLDKHQKKLITNIVDDDYRWSIIVDMLFTLTDENNDYVIDKIEWNSVRDIYFEGPESDQWAKKMFIRMDKNGNEEITQRECRKFFKVFKDTLKVGLKLADRRNLRVGDFLKKKTYNTDSDDYDVNVFDEIIDFEEDNSSSTMEELENEWKEMETEELIEEKYIDEDNRIENKEHASETTITEAIGNAFKTNEKIENQKVRKIQESYADDGDFMLDMIQVMYYEHSNLSDDQKTTNAKKRVMWLLHPQKWTLWMQSIFNFIDTDENEEITADEAEQFFYDLKLLEEESEYLKDQLVKIDYELKESQDFNQLLITIEEWEAFSGRFKQLMNHAFGIKDGY